jgi:hypothetical protein
LDYQYTVLKNEGQEGKIGLFWGWVPVRGGRHKERGLRCIWWMYFESIYENRIMKPVENVLRRGEKVGGIMVGVSLRYMVSTYVNICPPVQHYMLIKLIKK